MDIATQALLGASLAHATAPRREVRVAALIGACAAMLADADALLTSATDPLLVLEYHRHFSHALVFIPFGALLAALLLFPILSLLRWRIRFGRIYFYALLGYGTAGFLDACTSYGTHLWWPFSDSRVAWNLISIVDISFSLALAIPIAWGLARQRPAGARVGLALAAAILLLGLLQHGRAESTVRASLAVRGLVPEQLLIKPTISNLLLWRAVYVIDGHAFADAVRVGIGDGVRVYPGDSVSLFDAERDLVGVPAESRLRRDVDRFSLLSDGLVAVDPRRAEVLGDIRFSMLPTSVLPLWGIAIDRTDPASAPVFVTDRRASPEERRRFADMLLGRD